ncbi:MAG TPA: Coenzyme F420 hydrogenase/dehydrogenase, beta subunit C-terminal domain, partial [Clostridia bacterium]
SMVEDEEGFSYPQIDSDKCINCNICIRKCCFKSSMDEPSQINCYAVKHTNDAVRKSSSSGGFFPALAKQVLIEKGCVIGAGFDDNNTVCHMIINSPEEISRLQGSKYVESIIGDVYKKVKSILEEKRLVLFTGTPCQNAGLLNYLGKSYENLITSDVICHGTPSPRIFRDYMKFIENKYHDKIKKVTFREKIKGWHEPNMTINMSKKKYTCTWLRDPYYMLFFKNYSLRPSCYECRFAKHERITDITMADFWGIEKCNPQFDDNRGTSFVIVNTPKGREMFEKISGELVYEKALINDSEQPMLNHPSIMPEDRHLFFDDYINKGLKFCFKKYADYTLSFEIIYRIKKAVKKIIRL